jgi:DNA-binding transcriptional LysR family regulator
MLHLSTTAVSKQIKNLEHLIGEQVLIRNTRTVQLTEFGELFYQRSKAVDNELRVLEQFIESKKAEPQGNLKILVNTILSKKFIMDHLKKYMKRYPKVTLEINFSQFHTDLSRQDVDIMVGFPTYVPFTESLKFRKMYEVNNIVCASAKFIKHYGLPKTGADLLKSKIIGHGQYKPNYSFPLADGNFLATATPILYLSDFDAVTQAGLAGIGIFLTGDLLAQAWLDSGDLVLILPQYKFKRHEIFMFYRAYDFELPKVRSFIDFYAKNI